MRFELRGIGAWIAGAKGFSGQYPKELAKEFDDSVLRLFDRTQRRVHVWTGELKASGRVVPAKMSGESVNVGVEYTSDHGMWEMLRGGEHDFLTEPLNETMPELEAAATDVFVKLVNEWN